MNAAPWKLTRLRIRKLRIDAGYTQPQFGAAVGVGRSRISRIERGTAYCDIVLLVRIATFLQVSTDYVLGLKDKRN